MGAQREFILMVGTAGAAGAGKILRERSDDLSKRYSGNYLRETKGQIGAEYRNLEYVSAQMDKIEDDITYKVRISEGEGLFKALFRLGRERKSGLEAELERIPVLQSVIELCEFEDVSPYEIDSAGVMLLTASDVVKCLKKFEELEVKAVCIGYMAQDNNRIIKNGGETRFLTP